MKILYTTLLAILLSSLMASKIYAQAGNYSDFLPLQTGNVWIYLCSTNGMMCGGCSGKVRIDLTGDTLVNGKTYKKSRSTSSAISGSCQYCGIIPPAPLSNVRFDEQNGNVYRLSSNGCQYSPGEMMIDSFRARLYDSVRVNCEPPVQYLAYVCTDTNNAILFGTNRQARYFSTDGFEAHSFRKYAKGIGLYHEYIQSFSGTYTCTSQMTLLGCIINSVVYGDTSMLVGIEQVSGEIPVKFSLSQNYPNPFNPATTISFEIPKSEFVILTISDALGREVETILSKQLNPGTYQAEWNAANYPSGVYYYKLSAGEYTETKKMVLIK